MGNSNRQISQQRQEQEQQQTRPKRGRTWYDAMINEQTDGVFLSSRVEGFFLGLFGSFCFYFIKYSHSPSLHP